MTATDEPPHTRRLSLVLAVPICLALGAILGWTFHRPNQAAESAADTAAPSGLPPGVVEIPEAAQKNAGVVSAPAANAMLPVTLEVTGTVKVDDAKVAHVRPLARGLIERVWVRLGERVQKGQPLVTYDNVALGELVGDYLSAQATLRQAETEREVKRQQLERGRQLIKVEAISQQALELREAEFRTAEAGIAREQAVVARVEEQMHRFGLSDDDLKKLKPGDSESPHREASHTIVRAPFDGIVTHFEVAEGEVVESDREMFAINDLSTVWVLANVYERDLARVRAGSDATVRVETYSDRSFTGRITYVSDLIEPQTRSATVRVVVPNKDGALKLDMFARVSVPTNERKDVLAVPESAIQQVDGRSVVFVRQSPTKFERRGVETGLSASGMVEVRSGVTAGEQVVGNGSFYLKTALLRERIGDGD